MKSDLKVSIDAEYVKYLHARVTPSGELRLSVRIPWYIKKDLHSGNHANYSAVITLPKLEAITLSDAAILESEGTFVVDRFVGRVTDASDVKKLYLKGRDGDSDIEFIVSGTSDIDVEINNYQSAIKIKDVASATISGDFHYMGVEASGSTKVQIKGTTETSRYKSSGTAKIEASEFLAERAYVYARQSSHVKFNVSDHIQELRVTEAAKITLFSPEMIKIGLGSHW